jgi:hypothetical protein
VKLALSGPGCSQMISSLQKKNVTVQAARGMTLVTWNNATLTKRDSSRR